MVVIDGDAQSEKEKTYHAGKTFLAENYKKMYPADTVVLKTAKKFEMQVVAEQSPNRNVVFLDRQGESANRKLPRLVYKSIVEFQKERPAHFVIFSKHDLNYNLLPEHTFLVMKLHRSPFFNSSIVSWTEQILEKTYHSVF